MQSHPRRRRLGLIMLLAVTLLGGTAPAQAMNGPSILLRGFDPATPPYALTSIGDTLFFLVGTSSNGEALWKSDGTAAGTIQLLTVPPDNFISDLTPIGGTLFFTRYGYAAGQGLWKSDGTLGGTKLVKSGDVDGNLMVNFAGSLMFIADGQLWRIGGPDESPVLLTKLSSAGTIRTDLSNRGGLYRTAEGVDLTTVNLDGSGGYLLGWAKPGEWLNYTVDIASTSAYTLTASVAALGAGGSFHVTLDGADVSGPITIPDTGTWSTWQTTVGTPINLPTGRHTLRLVLDSAGASGYVGNIDWLMLDRASTHAFLPLVGR